MSAQMSFVYVKSLGHVLSVVTTIAALKGSFTAADLASPTLLVRNMPDPSTPNTVPDVSFYLTPDQLDVFTGDILDDALKNPRSFWFNPQSKKIEPIPVPTTLTVISSAATGIALALSPSPNPNTPVLVCHPGSDPTKSEVTPGTISGSPATLQVSGLVVNTYVLILVPGNPPVISKVGP